MARIWTFSPFLFVILTLRKCCPWLVGTRWYKMLCDLNSIYLALTATQWAEYLHFARLSLRTTPLPIVTWTV
ncbi:uncharacterized protein BDW70DRAFT_143002 [Aspergillus foveolatus]|uniref:uncharacterized protein n=1 Tax=Aspergillus foveolatus TaxID=210207 RepID=UPI003CCC94AC